MNFAKPSYRKASRNPNRQFAPNSTPFNTFQHFRHWKQQLKLASRFTDDSPIAIISDAFPSSCNATPPNLHTRGFIVKPGFSSGTLSAADWGLAPNLPESARGIGQGLQGGHSLCNPERKPQVLRPVLQQGFQATFSD